MLKKKTTMSFYSSYTCYHVANKIPNFQVLITTNLVLSQTKHPINIILFSVSMTLIVKILDELAYLGILERSNDMISTKALWRRIKAVYKCKVSGISNACPRLNIRSTTHEKVTTNLWFLYYLHSFSIVISENKMFVYNISL